MAWSQYRRLLHAHPLKTKALTSSCITGLADIGLQLYESNSNTQVSVESKQSHANQSKVACKGRCGTTDFIFQLPEVEWSRTMTLAAVGLIYSGPINHLWFATLEKLVRTQQQVASVMLKLLLDQMMFVPVAISGYMATRGILEGKSELQIRTQLSEKLLPATNAAWHFWPVVNLVSFSVVPVMYRVLFGNACAIFWNARLSYISSQPREHSEKDRQDAEAQSVSPIEELKATISGICCTAPMVAQLGFESLMTAVVEKMVEQAFLGSLV